MLTHHGPSRSNDLSPDDLSPDELSPDELSPGELETAAATAGGAVVPPQDLFAIPERLHVFGWNDPDRDLIAHDALSAYVERFWLGLLGPSTTWLLRILAHGLDAAPDGFMMDCSATARTLGLGDRFSRNSGLAKAFDRLYLFHLALMAAPGEVAVRRYVPWLARRHVVRLPIGLQREHQAWEAQRLGSNETADEQRRRAAQLALSMIRMGEDVASVERSLWRWKFHPSLCRVMAEWAWDQLHGEPVEA